MVSHTLKYELAMLKVAAAVALLGLNHSAQRQSQQPPLMLDIGANCGIYTMLFGANGYRCTPVEPLPTCILHIRRSIELNRFGERVDVQQHGASDVEATFEVPVGTCSPYYGLGHSERLHTNEKSYTTAVPARVFVPNHLDAPWFVKIDTEAHEAKVLASLAPLLRRRRIAYLFFELSPHNWFQANVTREWGYAALQDALDAPGYKSYLFAMGEGDRVMCKRMAHTTHGDACAHLRLPKEPEADGSHFGLRAIQQLLHSQAPVYGLPLGVANAVNTSWGRTSFGMNVLSVAPVGSPVWSAYSL